MRRLLHRHRWCTALVAGLLMLATSGVSLSRMTCLLGGHSIMAIGNISDCCPELPAGDADAISAVCCAYSEAGGDRVLTVASASMDINAMLVLVDAAPVLVLAEGPLSVQAPDGASKPPPLEVTDRLSRSGVYVI
jgi:hypothetical protein